MPGRSPADLHPGGGHSDPGQASSLKSSGLRAPGGHINIRIIPNIISGTPLILADMNMCAFLFNMFYGCCWELLGTSFAF